MQLTRQPKRLIQIAVLVVTLGFVLPSFADTVNILGSLPTDSSNQVILQTEAVFKINIVDFMNFSAQTLALPHGISDTELFLFNGAGLGVYGNDDQGGSDPLTSFLSCLPSAGLSNPCGYGNNGFGPTSDGIYFLAIAYSPDTPLDSGMNPIFQAGSTPILEPTSAGALASWDGAAYTQPDYDNNLFDIQLTGVPEPSSLALLTPGLLVAWWRGKRYLADRARS
jgi:hypothetical protein